MESKLLPVTTSLTHNFALLKEQVEQLKTTRTREWKHRERKSGPSQHRKKTQGCKQWNT